MMVSNNIILQNSGYSTAIGIPKDDTLDVKVLALCDGKFVDMNGTEVVIDREMINGIAEHYNSATRLMFEQEALTDPEATIEIFDNRNAPNQLNHDDTDVRKTVGHVVGLMEVKEQDERTYLYMTLRVKGKDAVDAVRLKKWRNLSVQFNPETKEFVEISWVVKGAVSEARSLLGKQSANTYTNTTSLGWTFGNAFDNITAKVEQYNRLKNELFAKRHLIALCQAKVITKAQANDIEARFSQFADPRKAVELIQGVMPVDRFKPKFIQDRSLLKQLKLSEQDMSDNVVEVTNLDEAARIALAKKKLEETETESRAERAEVDRYEYEEGKKAAEDKHKELSKKALAAYESGDMEMGKKLSDKVKALGEAIEKGDKVNLSEYEVEVTTTDSEEAKKIAEKLAAFKDEINKDIKLGFEAINNQLTVALSQQKQSQVSELQQALNHLTDVVAKLNTEGGK